MTDVRLSIPCFECGEEYDPENPGPEAHDPECAIRNAKIDMGHWDDPEVAQG